MRFRLMSAVGAARYYDVHLSTVYGWMYRGAPFMRLIHKRQRGPVVLVFTRELDVWLAEQWHKDHFGRRVAFEDRLIERIVKEAEGVGNWDRWRCGAGGMSIDSAKKWCIMLDPLVVRKCRMLNKACPL